ncbi:MAG: MerR family transcriptional regulator [Bacillota bacterium]|nr:MerR family transcriptional regulator [Bacillota bacterium]
MKINEVSKITGIRKRNIHFYIQEELISPSINQQNGYYEFVQKDVEQLQLIQSLRKADLPLHTIKLILKEPSTASFYLSQYLHSLYQKQEYLNQTIESMEYIVEHLPLHIRHTNLVDVVEQANIPTFNPREKEKDSALINRFLWSRFIPDGIQNDFHEFLWQKVNKLAKEKYTEDYSLLAEFLNSLSSQEIENMFKDNTKRYEFAVNLDQKGCVEYAKQLEENIRKNLKDPRSITFWKQYYPSFYLPNMRIYDSQSLQEIIKQISPFFKQYVENIHVVCELVYQNKELIQEMKNVLGNHTDFDSYHHAAIEAFGTIQNP